MKKTKKNRRNQWIMLRTFEKLYEGTDPTTSFQLILQDDEFSYDAVDNPVEIRDWRNPAEWPTSAKPVTRKMQYDDLNRVTQIEYQYPTATGKDPWKSPFAADFEAGNEDSRRSKPSPHQVFDSRPLVQSFAFDWLGNTTKTDDDAHGFYDRSLGKITNNSAENKPYQLVSAKQNTGDHTGNLNAVYDDAGNLIDLSVLRHGPCFPAGADCSQRFVYQWDEVGRLVRARRWDTPNPQVLDPEPIEAPAADLSYRYDASDNRVIKTARDDQGETVHTVYIFGSLELRRARFLEPDAVGAVPDYELSTQTEVGYLFAHGVRLARLHWDADGSPAVGGANLHVLFELGDHLGSSSKVLDKATSELVEASTYMGYGQAESDYRPGRWKGFREDYRFTGKEEDSEVGLTYFGKRFLSSQLGRWVSADPLAVHALGADPNEYAYVSGKLLSATDPFGLEELTTSDGASYSGCGLLECQNSSNIITILPPDRSLVGPPEAKKQPSEQMHDGAGGAGGGDTSVGVGGYKGASQDIIKEKPLSVEQKAQLRAYAEAGCSLFKPCSVVVGTSKLIVGGVLLTTGDYQEATKEALEGALMLSSLKEGKAAAEGVQLMMAGSKKVGAAAAIANSQNLPAPPIATPIPVDTATTIAGRQADLANRRTLIGLPAAGSAADRDTIARLEVNGQVYMGWQGHGQPFVLRTNAIS